MKGQEKQIKKATHELGDKLGKEKQEQYRALAEQVTQQGVMPKDALGMSDAMVEGIYGQAYRLYNTGKYQDSLQLFRLLIMLNPTESKYSLGMAACFHMLKDYRHAAESYALCSILDPENPVPH